MGNLRTVPSPDDDSARRRAEDVAYTLNHALVCTATDFIDPYLGNCIQKHLGNESQLKGAVLAEIAGDMGAVPFTVAMQRVFPTGMAAISCAVEPWVGGWFQASATRAATQWAGAHGVSLASPAYQARRDRIYRYEMEHLPQAILWTGSSIAINVSVQRGLGNKAPMAHILAGKVGGAALTALITLGGRSLFPHKAEEWDARLSEYVLLPVMRAVERLEGKPEPRKQNPPTESPNTAQCSDIVWQGRMVAPRARAY